MSLSGWLLDILFPPRCAFCGALVEPGSEGICPACRKTLPWSDHPRRRIDFVSSVSAPLYYEDAVRRAMLDYKFHGARARGEVFGWLVALDIQSNEDADYDVVTWAPLSRRRERSRGYDQAQLIAQAAAKTLGLEARPLLRKVRHVPPQSGVTSPEARRANVTGCYAVRDPEMVAGRRILLIDDVITTGATVSECARMLMLSGAESVSAAALAMRRKEKKNS
ncbi:MAG: ComF family protein [Oscillospiraceae bacterium]|nr:ComF family protein [Oscillospiraceae bacterium]